MGYVRSPKIYKLVFADPEMDGLEVRARSVDVGSFVTITKLASFVDSAGDVSPEKLEKVGELFERFAEVLVDWNLEERLDDVIRPVPATKDGLFSQDLDFVLLVIRAWMDAVADVPGPLDQRSPGGSLSLEVSLPMAPSYPSL